LFGSGYAGLGRRVRDERKPSSITQDDYYMRRWMMSIPNFSLSGEVAIVTGGKRGIGREIALALAGAGADVAVCTRRVDDGGLETVVEDIKKLGRRSLGIQADTSRKADVDNMVQKVMDQLGRIDILINNAGALIKAAFLEMSEDVWDKHMDVNLKGYYLVSQAVAKRMVERRKGCMINIASDLAFKAVPGMAAYCVSKAGIIMLTRALAQELGQYGIRVNAIAPGMIRTELSRPNWSDPVFLKYMETITPLGRIGELSDIVGVALLLASSASSYISGSTVLLNGGGLA
jgi:dehydrogenase/reductase SDR family protein 4